MFTSSYWVTLIAPPYGGLLEYQSSWCGSAPGWVACASSCPVDMPRYCPRDRILLSLLRGRMFVLFAVGVLRTTPPLTESFWDIGPRMLLLFFYLLTTLFLSFSFLILARSQITGFNWSSHGCIILKRISPDSHVGVDTGVSDVVAEIECLP